MPSFLCGILCVTIVFLFVLCVFCLAPKRAQNVGGSAGGVYLFPFRTQKSSLPSAMVLERGE